MILIFEGPDSTGKTNIAKAFCSKWSQFKYFKIEDEWTRLKKLEPEKAKLINIGELHIFTNLVKIVDMNIAMDRFYPSEYVYGTLFRNIDSEILFDFDRMLSQYSVKIILCNKPIEYLTDTIFDANQLQRIQDKYEEFAKLTSCDILRLDTTDEDLYRELTEIEVFIYGEN